MPDTPLLPILLSRLSPASAHAFLLGIAEALVHNARDAVAMHHQACGETAPLEEDLQATAAVADGDTLLQRLGAERVLTRAGFTTPARLMTFLDDGARQLHRVDDLGSRTTAIH